MSTVGVFDPITINGVEFKNRILRSSVGGRTCNYDGTVTDVWKNFEKRFAEGGIGGIVSTTFHVNRKRLSPPQYPSIDHPASVRLLQKFLPQIKNTKAGTCRYIIQIGDPGYTTYSSLFSEEQDSISASSGFDFAFGYNNTRRQMSSDEIHRAISNYARAAGRAREAGADGVEVTATKGYLIHQFLNPGINRRTDEWGGDKCRRFRLLGEIIKAIRHEVGRDFLLGVRLSGADFFDCPPAFAWTRFPWAMGVPERRTGNNLEQMLDYAVRLEQNEVDYLHVVSGYGFPNPRDVPGDFPFDEARMFFDSIRHLGFKAAVRATLMHFPFSLLTRPLLSLGWGQPPEINLPFATAFKQRVKIPVIANGGFQEYSGIANALQSKGSDMVSMARALIANWNLMNLWREVDLKPFEHCAPYSGGLKPCSRCNRCVGRTTTSPLGCYDLSRFPSQAEMMKQIMAWNQADLAPCSAEQKTHGVKIPGDCG